MIRYFKIDAEEMLGKNELARGIVWTMIGLCLIFFFPWLTAAFPSAPMIYGVLFLILAVTKIQRTADMIRIKQGLWWMPLVCVVISLLHVVMIFANPFVTTDELWHFVGVSLIIDTVIDSLALLIVQKLSNKT